MQQNMCKENAQQYCSLTSPLPFHSLLWREHPHLTSSRSQPFGTATKALLVWSQVFLHYLDPRPFQLPPLSALWFFIKGCLETQIKGGVCSEAPTLTCNHSDRLWRLARAQLSPACPSLPRARPTQGSDNSVCISPRLSTRSCTVQ